MWFFESETYSFPILGDFSGTNFCTGDFAPPEPEFGPEFWETNFGRPNFGPEFWGRILWSYFFQEKRPPRKFTVEKFTSQNSPSKIQPRNRAKKFTLHLCRAIWLRILASAKADGFPTHPRRLLRNLSGSPNALPASCVAVNGGCHNRGFKGCLVSLPGHQRGQRRPPFSLFWRPRTTPGKSRKRRGKKKKTFLERANRALEIGF